MADKTFGRHLRSLRHIERLLLNIALVASRALTTLLFGVSPSDPLTFALSAAGLAAAALAAAYGPARRATRIDPVLLLR